MPCIIWRNNFGSWEFTTGTAEGASLGPVLPFPLTGLPVAGFIGIFIFVSLLLLSSVSSSLVFTSPECFDFLFCLISWACISSICSIFCA